MTPVLQTSRLLLKPMCLDDAHRIGLLYTNQEVSAHYSLESLTNATEVENFVNRIITSSNHVWTIRFINNSDYIIGDCAMHHYEPNLQSIELGGTLFPQYWGSGIMAEAMLKMTVFARSVFNIRKIIFKTSFENKNAIRFAEKLDFSIDRRIGGELTFIKEIS